MACPEQTFAVGVPDPTKEQIAVGPGALEALGYKTGDLKLLGDEGFSWMKSGSLGGAISGGDEVTAIAGTTYGVYHLLQQLGFRFIASDETFVPACPTSLPLTNATSIPSFELRDNNQWQPREKPTEGFNSTVGLNLWDTQVGYNGARVTYASPPGFVHTAYNILYYPQKVGHRLSIVEVI
jgi:hypothetical protein